MAWVPDGHDPGTAHRASEASRLAGPLYESGNPPVRVTLAGDAHPGNPGFTEATALLEADRCLRCGGPLEPAPCNTACPADLDVPRFVAALARGSWEEAAQAIFAANLLGASCARICPSEALCEAACVLAREGKRPIEISELERYTTDLAFQNPWATFRTRALPTGKRVSVIGAGPAGLICAGELAAMGHVVRLFEAAGEYSGLLKGGITPDRADHSPLPDEVRAIIGLGVELFLDCPVNTPERLWEIEYNSDAIFLGVGLETADHRYPGDSLPGILGTLQFADRVRQSQLAPGTRVVVTGGGGTAIDVAREAVRLGAAEVTVLGQRSELELPADRAERAAARADGIRFLRVTGPLRFRGTDRLEGVECEATRFEETGEYPIVPPAAEAERRMFLPADLVVEALGREPQLDFLRWVDGLDMDRGRPQVDAATGQTTNPKYFACGSEVDRGGNILAAIAAGKRAARGIDRWFGEPGCAARSAQSMERVRLCGTAGQEAPLS